LELSEVGLGNYYPGHVSLGWRKTGGIWTPNTPLQTVQASYGSTQILSDGVSYAYVNRYFGTIDFSTLALPSGYNGPVDYDIESLPPPYIPDSGYNVDFYTTLVSSFPLPQWEIVSSGPATASVSAAMLGHLPVRIHLLNNNLTATSKLVFQALLRNTNVTPNLIDLAVLLGQPYNAPENSITFKTVGGIPVNPLTAGDEANLPTGTVFLTNTYYPDSTNLYAYNWQFNGFYSIPFSFALKIDNYISRIPASFSATGLPVGVTMDSSGNVAGTIAAPGDYTATITVLDASSNVIITTTLEFTITV
jgi:hypothetical protein